MVYKFQNKGGARSILLVNSLPMDVEQVAHAAREMITQHGDSALMQADKQISTCEAEGFGSVAETWKLICEAIRQIQQSDRKVEGYRKALERDVSLSE